MANPRNQTNSDLIEMEELEIEDSSNPRLRDDDLLVVAIWTALGIFGMVTNILILAGVCQNRKLRQSSSYWLIMSLSVCDIGMLIVCLAHLIPSTVWHERFVEIIDFSNAFGIFVYDSFWYTGVYHLMIMSINRYVNICRPKRYVTIFSHRKTLVIILGLYCSGVALATPGLFACCYLVFNHEIYAGQYEPKNTPYRYVDMCVNGLCVVVMSFCYVCIVVRVRRSRIMLQQYRKLCREQTKTALAYARIEYRQNSIALKLTRLLRPRAAIASRREVKLFFQFAAVSVIFFLTFFTWSWLPHMSSDSKWIGFAVTSLFFLNNSINPVVYLIFNSVLRRQIQRMFRPFRRDENAVAIQRQSDRVLGDNQHALVARPTPLSDKRSPVSIIRRLKSSASMYKEQNGRNYRRNWRRRSTAFEAEDDERLVKNAFGSRYELTENESGANTACNLMAMAAFLNTTAFTGGVLLKALADENERPNSDKEITRDCAISDKSAPESSIDLARVDSIDAASRRSSQRHPLSFYFENAQLIDDDEESVHL